jgi:hypothetical protein
MTTTPPGWLPSVLSGMQRTWHCTGLPRRLVAATSTGSTSSEPLRQPPQRAMTFIEVTGLQLLLETTRISATTDWAFFIVQPSEAVTRLIEITRTFDRLTLVDAAPAQRGPG